MPNRLAQEVSPYLLQHSRNPVDWFPWGEEAFQRARNEDKPILLSIGYSACHWCHVMEHESFENEAIARFMNENFINIKVDREERPDLDHIYMEAVQAMTQSGGWPLTVFLTPEGKPFYGGTYFPPEDRFNMPGFPQVLKAISETYRNRRNAVEQATGEITDLLSGMVQASTPVGALTEKYLKQAYLALESGFDRQNGGFGRAPKFPQPLILEFLLKYFAHFREYPPLEMVEITLDRMAQGGIYDQIGGGFHRYATDHAWQVPHFEKMLYDNALLSRVYLQASLATGKGSYAEIAEETLDYVLREMKSPEGGFYSTQDADSEGEEGKYYLWTAEEIREVLKDKSREAEEFFGVTPEGNFEGRNILHRTSSQPEPDTIKEIKKKLLARREQRIKPDRDEKALASWNGLMLSSLAEAAGVLQRQDYLSAAVANGEFILNSLIRDGKLCHVYKDGQTRISGFLEDYALVIEGMLALHQITLEGRWLKKSLELTQQMIELFYDRSTGLLYDTQVGQADLIIRPRNDYDGAVPSGTSAATGVLLRMAVLTGNDQFRKIAERALQTIKVNLGRYPLGYGQWLCDLDFYLSSPREIVITGNRSDSRTRQLIRVIYSKWLPDKVIAGLDPEDPDNSSDWSLLEGRGMVNGQPTVYICRNNICQSPVQTPEDLERALV